MPEAELFTFQEVILEPALEDHPQPPGRAGQMHELWGRNHQRTAGMCGGKSIYAGRAPGSGIIDQAQDNPANFLPTWRVLPLAGNHPAY